MPAIRHEPADRLRWIAREWPRLIGYGLRYLRHRVLRWTGNAVARELRRRATVSRDAHRYDLAAALFEEALRFAPGDQRTHVQTGHMYKEAGDLVQAERHYREAERLGPRTADLALQLGHFLKVAGRSDEAAAAYADALAMRPGWPAAADELTRISIALAEESAGGDFQQVDPDEIVPELLPRSTTLGAVPHDTLQVRRLGASRMRSRWGMLKVLRGVEAIRGFCISSVDLKALQVLVDGALVWTEALHAHPLGDGAQHVRKYVFNAWYDFAGVPSGKVAVELRLVDARDRSVRTHRETLLVAEPVLESAHPGSDALVKPPPGPGTLEQRVNALPSMVRGVGRTLVTEPIRNVLVQRVDQLGDMVCSLPAIRRLRTLFPKAQLVGLVTDANAALASSYGIFDEIIVADFPVDPRDGRRAMSLAAQHALLGRLSSYCFDLAIDLGEGAESRPLLLLSGARFLAGFKDREFPWLSAGFDFNGHDPIDRIEIMPPSRKILALVESVGAMLRVEATITPNPSLDRGRLKSLGLDTRERYVVLHAGARLIYSRWPYFGELAALLLERTDLSLVLFTDDAAEAAAIARSSSSRLKVMPPRLPFDDFDAVLSFCTAFVGNDTGPKHLAALRGAPVVSLHMARLNWSEWGQEMTGAIVSRRVPCAGCGIGDRGEECGKAFACLHHITPEEVFAAVQPFL